MQVMLKQGDEGGCGNLLWLLRRASRSIGSRRDGRSFWGEMDRIMPWPELESLIEPHYPKDGNGRPPIGLSIMLRIYFLQHWFNLSDPAAANSADYLRQLSHTVQGHVVPVAPEQFPAFSSSQQRGHLRHPLHDRDLLRT
jgi:hypothetical protein